MARAPSFRWDDGRLTRIGLELSLEFQRLRRCSRGTQPRQANCIPQRRPGQPGETKYSEGCFYEEEEPDGPYCARESRGWACGHPVLTGWGADADSLYRLEVAGRPVRQTRPDVRPYRG